MRIIAGEFRGRRLLGPKSEVTRPITDRAKQSLFDILSPRIAGARVYDCFAGTGSMGLESLSREAASAVFFERDRDAVMLLRKNVQTLDVSDRATVIDADIFKWFARPGSRAPTERADIIFLDPPYRLLREQPTDLQELTATMARDHLAADGVVVFRHDAADELPLPPLRVQDQREYGGMMIEILGING
jgi:16S rRNA (guanine966-N2)-methyltransferase